MEGEGVRTGTVREVSMGMCRVSDDTEYVVSLTGQRYEGKMRRRNKASRQGRRWLRMLKTESSETRTEVEDCP